MSAVYTRVPTAALTAQLKLTEMRVLMTLCTFLGTDAHNRTRCWPSYETIAERCAMARKRIPSIVKALESYGLIRRLPSNYRSNLYEICFEAEGPETSPEECKETEKRPDEAPTATPGFESQEDPSAAAYQEKGSHSDSPQTGDSSVPKTGATTVPKLGTLSISKNKNHQVLTNEHDCLAQGDEPVLLVETARRGAAGNETCQAATELISQHPAIAKPSAEQRHLLEAWHVQGLTARSLAQLLMTKQARGQIPARLTSWRYFVHDVEDHLALERKQTEAREKQARQDRFNSRLSELLRSGMKTALADETAREEVWPGYRQRQAARKQAQKQAAKQVQEQARKSALMGSVAHG